MRVRYDGPSSNHHLLRRLKDFETEIEILKESKAKL